MEPFDPAELPELLKLYYRRLFPYAQYYRWLNYGGGDGGGEPGVGPEGRGGGSGRVPGNDSVEHGRQALCRVPSGVMSSPPQPLGG